MDQRDAESSIVKPVQRESRNDITERTVPINVRDQISSANQPQYWGMIPSDAEPVALARESVQAVYIPMGKTLLHEGGP